MLTTLTRTLTITSHPHPHPHPHTPSLTPHPTLTQRCVELVRRAQWAAFRIEWQHFNNLKKKHEEAAAEQARAEQLVRDYAMDRHRRPVLGF